MNYLIRSVKERLLKRKRNCLLEVEGRILAAVMLILNIAKPKPSLLFIKRPQRKEDIFSGHVAFPGGKKAESDKDLKDTAIRETLEEVGIDIRKCGMIIGTLEPVIPYMISGENTIIVTPFLSLVDKDIRPEINTQEVQECDWIPVSYLADERNMRIRKKYRDGRYIDDFVYSYGGYLIWGMTGRIVRDFLLEFGDLFN